MYTHFFTRLSSLSQKNLLDSFTSFCSFSLFNFQGPARHLLGDSFLIISHTFPFVNNFFLLSTSFFSNFFVYFAIPLRTAYLLYHIFTVCHLLFYSIFVFFLLSAARSLERSCIIYLLLPFVNGIFSFTPLYTKRVVKPLFLMYILDSLLYNHIKNHIVFIYQTNLCGATHLF